MKMKYEEPEIKVVKFDTSNIMLTVSEGDGDSGDFGELFG